MTVPFIVVDVSNVYACFVNETTKAKRFWVENIQFEFANLIGTKGILLLFICFIKLCTDKSAPQTWIQHCYGNAKRSKSERWPLQRKKLISQSFENDFMCNVFSFKCLFYWCSSFYVDAELVWRKRADPKPLWKMHRSQRFDHRVQHLNWMPQSM